MSLQYFLLLSSQSVQPYLVTLPNIPDSLHPPSLGYMLFCCCCQFWGFIPRLQISLSSHLHISVSTVLEFYSVVTFPLNPSLTTSINFILHCLGTHIPFVHLIFLPIIYFFFFSSSLKYQLYESWDFLCSTHCCVPSTLSSTQKSLDEYLINRCISQPLSVWIDINDVMVCLR